MKHIFPVLLFTNFVFAMNHSNQNSTENANRTTKLLEIENSIIQKTTAIFETILKKEKDSKLVLEQAHFEDIDERFVDTHRKALQQCFILLQRKQELHKKQEIFLQEIEKLELKIKEITQEILHMREIAKISSQKQKEAQVKKIRTITSSQMQIYSQELEKSCAIAQKSQKKLIDLEKSQSKSISDSEEFLNAHADFKNLVELRKVKLNAERYLLAETKMSSIELELETKQALHAQTLLDYKEQLLHKKNMLEALKTDGLVQEGFVERQNDEPIIRLKLIFAVEQFFKNDVVMPEKIYHSFQNLEENLVSKINHVHIENMFDVLHYLHLASMCQSLQNSILFGAKTQILLNIQDSVKEEFKELMELTKLFLANYNNKKYMEKFLNSSKIKQFVYLLHKIRLRATNMQTLSINEEEIEKIFNADLPLLDEILKNKTLTIEMIKNNIALWKAVCAMIYQTHSH